MAPSLQREERGRRHLALRLIPDVRRNRDMFTRFTIATFTVAILLASCSSRLPSSAGIQSVLIHAPFQESYSCSEHWDGQFQYLGDALGSDCTIHMLEEIDGRLWVRRHQGKGLTNADWYGWGSDVLAPCNCSVSRVRINDVENEPGVLGDPPASSITFVTNDGVHILIAHVRDVVVAEGNTVRSGEKVAVVGNNGYSRNPHIHIGAWRDEEPLQIRIDQTTIKK